MEQPRGRLLTGGAALGVDEKFLSEESLSEIHIRRDHHYRDFQRFKWISHDAVGKMNWGILTVLPCPTTYLFPSPAVVLDHGRGKSPIQQHQIRQG